MSTRIEEPLPTNPISAEAVLHVRRKLRAIVREKRGGERARALALLFGRPETDESSFRTAAASGHPFASAADLVATDGVAALGSDEAHVDRCREWLLREKESDDAFREIIAFDLGTLLALSRARDLARAGATKDRPPVAILIRGETGTGKELLASAIHQLSGRANGLHAVHIAGMPTDQVNVELFGHVVGAFTGATKERKGRIEEADGGSLLLDEVGDLSAEAQVRLLRVLQNGKFSRLGENRERHADVRIIAATWHDLAADSKPRKKQKPTFREDLYHRICVGEVVLPPLRERRVEMRRLLGALLQQLGWTGSLTRSAADALLAYGWPGNLRELDGVLRIALGSAAGAAAIRLEDLPPNIQRHYLLQPLEVRAPGMLCDDPDDLELTPEVLGGRLLVLGDLLAADTPMPDIPPIAEAFFEGMEALPDPSGTHLATLQELRQNLDREREGVHRHEVGKRLATIALAPDMPEAVLGAITLVAQQRIHDGKQEIAAAEGERAEIDIMGSPWMRLYHELTAMPLFKNQGAAEILGVLSFGARLAQSVAPEFVEEIVSITNKGGVQALIARGKAALIESVQADRQIEADTLPVPAGHPRSWTAEQWQGLVSQCHSRRMLEEALGLDGKTIKRYLDRSGIVPSWAREA